jgi:predicted RNA-binding protein with PUA-like domain
LVKEKIRFLGELEIAPFFNIRENNMNYWLMKSEPTTYGINHLAQEKQCIWDGVRNYQARNFLRSMAVGDIAFFYHSNTQPPGIVGLMQIIESNIDDPSQFNPESPYFDSKSDPQKPRWQTVKVELKEIFPTMITLERLRNSFSAEQLMVVQKGSRLSITPVAKEIALEILSWVG